jgi:alpha-L-fucosidase
VRWVGNERGVAGETCWATLNRDDFVPGRADEKRLNSGDRPGTHWVPAECDVSIRPGWFYHEKEDTRVRSAKNLVDLYYASVGRGASFHLNLPVDRRGQIHEIDAKSLIEFRRMLDATFSNNLIRNTRITATNTRNNARRFSTSNLTDHSRETYWATDDGELTPSLIVEFGKAMTFNVVRLREYLPLGQRVESVAIDEWRDGQWQEVAKATSIGNCRLIRMGRITTTKIRLRITSAAASPAISEVGLFLEPDS